MSPQTPPLANPLGVFHPWPPVLHWPGRWFIWGDERDTYKGWVEGCAECDRTWPQSCPWTGCVPRHQENTLSLPRPHYPRSHLQIQTSKQQNEKLLTNLLYLMYKNTSGILIWATKSLRCFITERGCQKMREWQEWQLTLSGSIFVTQNWRLSEDIYLVERCEWQENAWQLAHTCACSKLKPASNNGKTSSNDHDTYRLWALSRVRNTYSTDYNV